VRTFMPFGMSARGQGGEWKNKRDAEEPGQRGQVDPFSTPGLSLVSDVDLPSSPAAGGKSAC